MRSTILLITTISLLSFFSCKKNQLGGNATIKGTVLHHSKPIGNAIVYIKFNSKDFPGSDTTKYDDQVKADANGNYTIKCYKGDYYLYGYGFDYSVSPPRVVGGVPVHVRNKENLTVDVAVTEN